MRLTANVAPSSKRRPDQARNTLCSRSALSVILWASLSQHYNHLPTTAISPRAFRVGFTVIRTSCPSAVRNSISRPTEKLPARLRISAETCGCLMPSTPPLRLRQAARLDDLVDLQGQARLQQLLLRVGQAEVGKHIAAASLGACRCFAAHVSSTFLINLCASARPLLY